MPAASFKTWLQRAKRTDDPAGDFIEDTRRRGVLVQLPEDFRSLASLRRLMRRINAFADDEAMAAAGEVWQRYQRYRKAKA